MPSLTGREQASCVVTGIPVGEWHSNCGVRPAVLASAPPVDLLDRMSWLGLNKGVCLWVCGCGCWMSLSLLLRGQAVHQSFCCLTLQTVP